MEIINTEDIRKALVVAPHQDDESIGCGGLLAILKNRADVLLVFDGASKPEVTMAERDAELDRAIALAGANLLGKMALPEAAENRRPKDICLDAYDLRQYDCIFIPNRYEANDDHRAVNRAVTRYVKKKKLPATVYQYEVWTPMRLPDCMVDITSVAETKKAMIRCHKTQLAYHDYEKLGMGISAYRGAKHGCAYAEVFTAPEQFGVVKAVYAHLPQWVQKLYRALRNAGKKR